MSYFDNPQVVFTYDPTFGNPPACVSCGGQVDRAGGYLALWAGVRTRPDLIAVAHPTRCEGSGDDDWTTTCSDALRERWHHLLDGAGAGVLVRGEDGGGRRWFLRGEGLHAGTSLELLTAEGVWLRGRFEYEIAPRFEALFYFRVAGFDPNPTGLTIPTGSAVRIPPACH